MLVINRVNASNESTPAAREYIEYSGTSGTTVLITTRNVDSSNSALTHAVGSTVEFIPDVTWADRIYDALANVVDVDDLSVDTTKVATPASVTSSSIVLSGSNYFSASGATISLIKDEDDMVSNSATALATQQSIKAYADSVTVADSDGATITFDLGSGAYRKHAVTLGGNRTLALSNALTGMAFIISLTQDGTGSRTVTWFSTIKWAGGSAPTLTTTADKRDVFGFICTGSGTYDGFVVGQNL